MFKLFLKKNEIRTLTVLSRLRATHYTSKQDLSETLSIPQSTLNRDIKELDSILKLDPELPQIEIKGNNLKIINTPKKNNSNTLLRTTLQYYVEKSYPYQIMQCLAICKKIEIDNLCEQVSISKSYLFQQLSTLNSYLNTYHVQIKIIDNHVQFDGPLQNRFVVTFLLYDTNCKLFSEQPIQNAKELSYIKNALNEEVKPDFNPVNTRRSLNLLKYYHLYLDELERTIDMNSELGQLLDLFNRYFPVFNEPMPKNLRPFFSFLTNLTFTRLRQEDEHVEILSKMLKEDLPLIHESNEVSQALLSLIPTLSKPQQILFSGTVLIYTIYLNVFGCDIKEPFSNSDLLVDLMEEGECIPVVDLKDDRSLEAFKHLTNNSVLPLVLKYNRLFEQYIEFFYWYNQTTTLSIRLDFENSVIFEHYVQKELEKLFNTSILNFSHDDTRVDLIISDQLYKDDQADYFFYYPDLQSEFLFDSLVAYIPAIYTKKNKRITNQKIKDTLL
ncbi:helix-turn-helix domain-containing protein [Vagococcus fessus]|uniref:helix-turn-helix domain-containing protein n=1 Tax=Vagococcus fessus TaxID=120370 RepID=UPI001474B517|nr:helix-turn-helix domain-containing protein [Vagococcus fessus]